MNTVYKTQDFEQAGIQFRAEFSVDYCHGEPWKEEDGHGEVTDWETRAKRPGELILSESRNHKRFYDLAGAVAKAKAEGWRAPDSELHPEWTEGQEAHHAAMADFERLRAWCAGDWRYSIIEVFPLTEDGDELRSKAAALSGLQSDDSGYLEAVLIELAAEVLESHPELLNVSHA